MWIEKYHKRLRNIPETRLFWREGYVFYGQGLMGSLHCAIKTAY